MACCCFCARLGTFGSGVEFAAGWGFEQEQIIPSEPAANRVIRIFLMSIWGQQETTSRPADCQPIAKTKTRDMEMPRAFDLNFFSHRAYRGE